jgi:tRNA(Ile)-lysidine synthase
MYYGAVQSLPETVLAYVQKHDLLRAGDRAGVAVSGGADSVALLRLLLDLRHHIGIVLCIVHFNHKLRSPQADEDERFASDLAAKNGLEFHSASSNVKEFASAERLSLETAARKLRYQYFFDLLRGGTLDRIATAHTLDDQAETVLLRMARGAGTRGLAGIYPHLTVPGPPFAERRRTPAIVRPLLQVRRHEHIAYLESIGQTWREDESNRDLRHSRNRARHTILPLLERELNPSVKEALAEMAEIARAEEANWENATQDLLKSSWRARNECGTLQTSVLTNLPLALRRRLLRAAAESLGFRLEFRHVEEILSLSHKLNESATLPDGWVVRAQKSTLEFQRNPQSASTGDYEYPLALPGSTEVPQAGSRIEASIVTRSDAHVYNADHLYDPAQLKRELRVRNWRPGDRFWPAHTKAPKKIKDLLQARDLARTERKQWPVVVCGTEVVWVRGFAVPSRLQPRSGALAVWIRDVPLAVG